VPPANRKRGWITFAALLAIVFAAGCYVGATFL